MRLPVVALILVTALPSAATAQIREWRPDLLAMYESEGGKNIPNFKFDGPYGTHSAGGVCQMLTRTWLRVAPTIDIDTVKFPVAGSAPEFMQWQACWKLWTLDGYDPWTCPGCNPKLRQILGKTAAPSARRASVSDANKASHEIAATTWHELTAEENLDVRN